MVTRNILEFFDDGYSVNSIATGRDQLLVCKRDDFVAEAQERNYGDFDHIPVIDEVGDVVGVLNTNRQCEESAQVADVFEPLSNRNLVSERSSIMSFVQSLGQQSYNFVVGRKGITGLVTWSDTQKLPARAALFGLVTKVELSMMERIRCLYSGDTWFDILSAGRKARVEQKVADARSRDSLIDTLHYTDFCDKRDLLKKQHGGNAFVATLRKIEGLRNSLAHASDYVASYEDAVDLAGVVHEALEIIGELEADRQTSLASGI